MAPNHDCTPRRRLLSTVSDAATPVHPLPADLFESGAFSQPPFPFGCHRHLDLLGSLHGAGIMPELYNRWVTFEPWEASNATRPKRNNHVEMGRDREALGCPCRRTEAGMRIARMPVAHMGSCVPGCSACYPRAAGPSPSPQPGGCSQLTTSDPVYVSLCHCEELAVTQALVTRVRCARCRCSDTRIHQPGSCSRGAPFHLTKPCLLICPCFSRHTALLPTSVPILTQRASLSPPDPG